MIDSKTFTRVILWSLLKKATFWGIALGLLIGVSSYYGPIIHDKYLVGHETEFGLLCYLSILPITALMMKYRVQEMETEKSVTQASFKTPPLGEAERLLFFHERKMRNKLEIILSLQKMRDHLITAGASEGLILEINTQIRQLEQEYLTGISVKKVG